MNIKNSQKGFVDVLLLVLIAVLLVGGGTYVVYTQKKQVMGQPVTINLPMITQATQATSTVPKLAQFLHIAPCTRKLPTVTLSTIIDASVQATSTTIDTSLPLIAPQYNFDYNYTTDDTGMVIGQQLVFVARSPSKRRIVVPTDVAIKIDGNSLSQKTGIELPLGGGQSLSSGIVINPLDENEIIFASREITCMNRIENYLEETQRIYSYNLNTNDLKLLFTMIMPTHFEGYDIVIGGSRSSNVILFFHLTGTGGWTDSCRNPWNGGVFYLDLKNLSAGLQKYIVPLVELQKAQALENECRLNQLSPNPQRM